MNLISPVVPSLSRLREEIVEVCRYYSGVDCSIHLDGYCGVASYLVHLLFISKGFDGRDNLHPLPKWCYNNCHVFNKVGKYYVDLTASQFDCGLPLIYIKRKPCQIGPFLWQSIHQIRGTYPWSIDMVGNSLPGFPVNVHNKRIRKIVKKILDGRI